MNCLNRLNVFVVVALVSTQVAHAEGEFSYKRSCLASCTCFSSGSCTTTCPKDCHDTNCVSVRAALSSFNSLAKLKLQNYFDSGTLRMSANASLTMAQFIDSESSKYDNFATVAAGNVACAALRKRDSAWDMHSLSERGSSCYVYARCPIGGGSVVANCDYKCRPCDDVRTACDSFSSDTISDYTTVIANMNIELSQSLNRSSFLGLVQNNVQALRDQSVTGQGCFTEATSGAWPRTMIKALLIASLLVHSW